MKSYISESSRGFRSSPTSARPLQSAGLAVLFACLGNASVSAITPDEDVFYPIPQNIALPPNEQPTPTQALMERDNGAYALADSDDEMTLNAYVFLPDGIGPHPAVILLHGSGGLWSNENIDLGIGFQYREWATELTERGYLVIMPDSYHPRGIDGNFGGKRPNINPAQDDTLCSPNYERPKDVVATLAYLQSRPDVDDDNIGILSFSQGAQTALNSILDQSIDLSPYVESCLNGNNPPFDRPAPDPIRIPNNLPFPKVVVAYYPGCGFFDYHGSPNSTSAGRYMPDSRTKVLMAHGTSDFVMDDDFPVTLVAASRAHALANNFDDPFIYHYLFEGVGHSFDGSHIDIEPEENWWNLEEETPTEAAKRIARKETLRQFGYRLKGEPYLIIPKFTLPDDVDSKLPIGEGEGSSRPALTWKDKSPLLEWSCQDGLSYQLVWYSSRGKSEAISPELFDLGRGFSYSFDYHYLLEGKLYLEILPGLEAWMDWRNLGLLRYDSPFSTSKLSAPIWAPTR